MASSRQVRPVTAVEAAWVVMVSLMGLALRLWHLGTPSLWWDELVHVGTAWQPDAWSVFQHVKRGMPPGFGNAGAMPIDYLVLHAYLQVVPMPRPEHLEAYFRAPACAASALTPLVLWWWGRRAFGRGVALVAATLLTLSIPHVLYAVEARSYALLACLTVLELAAFTRLVESPSLGRWLGFGGMSLLYVLTGILGLLLVGILFVALLGQLVWRSRRRDGRRTALGRDLPMLGGAALVMAGSLYVYFLGTYLSTTARRKVAASDPLGTTLQALSYYVSDDPVLLALLASSVVVVPFACWRRPERRPPVLIAPLMLALVVVVPAIVELERQRRYYFHPRHALFLLPIICTVIALVLDVVARWIDARGLVPGSPAARRLAAVGAQLVLILVLTAPRAAAYVARPLPFFARTKAVRDFKGLARTLQTAARAFAPDEKMLVLAEQGGEGFLANTALTLYLRWYRLEDRVVLRGVVNPNVAVVRLADVCGEGCRGGDGPTVERTLAARDVLTVPPAARRLLGIERPLGAWPGRLRTVTLVTYTKVPPGPWARPLTQGSFSGFTTWQPLADARAPS